MAALAAPQLPMATVATGTPFGICTIESNASMPPSGVAAIGTPITGKALEAASTPGSAAAPPAAAISTPSPRASAVDAYSSVFFGVRCAEATTTSLPTSSRSSTFTVSSMISRSESLPSTMPTRIGLVTSVLLRGHGLAPPDVRTEVHTLEADPAHRLVRALDRSRHVGSDGGDTEHAAAGGDQPAVAQSGAGMEDLHPGERGGFVDAEDRHAGRVRARVDAGSDRYHDRRTRQC